MSLKAGRSSPLSQGPGAARATQQFEWIVASWSSCSRDSRDDVKQQTVLFHHPIEALGVDRAMTSGLPLALEERVRSGLSAGTRRLIARRQAADGADLDKLELPTDERKAEALAETPTACCAGSWAQTSLSRNPLEARGNLCL